MKKRLLSIFVVALAVAFSVAIASDNHAKSTKTSTVKKEMKGCCSDASKSSKGCTDKEMMDCDTKEMKSSTKTKDASTQTKAKSETKTPEKK
jgi:hypothetical protein